MKNFITFLSFFFVVATFAQTKKKTTVVNTKIESKATSNVIVTPEIGGLKNITDLAKFIPLKPETKSMLQELFTTKYRMLAEAGNSAERKSIVTQAIVAKLQSSLDNATFQKIAANKVLFASLLN